MLEKLEKHEPMNDQQEKYCACVAGTIVETMNESEFTELEALKAATPNFSRFHGELSDQISSYCLRVAGYRN
jgi:hypothetical protein